MDAFLNEIIIFFIKNGKRWCVKKWSCKKIKVVIQMDLKKFKNGKSINLDKKNVIVNLTKVF